MAHDLNVFLEQNEPLFIGISRRVVNVRPTAFFFIKCALLSPQVLEYYQRAADRFESSQLLLVPQVASSVSSYFVIFNCYLVRYLNKSLFPNVF